MRMALVALAGAIGLAGCDSDVPSPAERQQQADSSAAAIPVGTVELSGRGLSAGPESFYFAAGKTEVEAALARTLGQPLRTGTNAECGAGPMVFTDFAGGLTAHFQDDRLVGWNWHAPQDGDADPVGTVRLSGMVQLGNPRAVAAAAPGFSPVEGSTLGEEFALGQAIGGFIEGDAVDMLYAGTQCFFR